MDIHILDLTVGRGEIYNFRDISQVQPKSSSKLLPPFSGTPLVARLPARERDGGEL